MSGQGPYFGQAGWFNVLHSEKLPSAISRYQDEVRRIHGVLEGWLAKQEQHSSQWLAWHERITSRPSWKKAMELRAKLMDEQGLTWTGTPKGFERLAEYQEVLKANDETATDASTK
ncbi:hypothetical protein LQW54_010909 [Pestalotiopsis sp. IQ-011]